jgi:hypothetical protein
MRRALLLLLAAAALALVPTTAFAQSDLDCKDFPSQAAAQAKLDADPSDPHRLDADDDGKACETFPYPGGGQQADTDTDTGAAASGSDEGEELPFTGPGTLTLVVGGVLLTAGAGLAWAGRHRARHATR